MVIYGLIQRVGFQTFTKLMKQLLIHGFVEQLTHDQYCGKLNQPNSNINSCVICRPSVMVYKLFEPITYMYTTNFTKTRTSQDLPHVAKIIL